MKKLLLLFNLLSAMACTHAQTPDAKTIEAKKYMASIEHIAPFRILTTDSTYLTPANLKKGMPVMVIYFSPDCSHCQHMMYELKPKMKELKNIQVVMITWSRENDIRPIREFQRDFDLKKYPNFTLGTEGYTAKAQNYYQVKTTPFIAIYNKGGNISKYFDKVVPVDTILAAVKKV